MWLQVVWTHNLQMQLMVVNYMVMVKYLWVSASTKGLLGGNAALDPGAGNLSMSNIGNTGKAARFMMLLNSIED